MLLWTFFFFLLRRLSQPHLSSFPSTLPVPMGMFMNMSHVPPRFFNKQQQIMQQQNRGGGMRSQGEFNTVIFEKRTY